MLAMTSPVKTPSIPTKRAPTHASGTPRRNRRKKLSIADVIGRLSALNADITSRANPWNA